MSGKYGSVYNLRVQEYRGQKYLTFWVGDDTITGHGTGSYIMVGASLGSCPSSLTDPTSSWISTTTKPTTFLPATASQEISMSF